MSVWIDQSLKIQNMSLKLITLAAFAATAQATPKVTACTAAQTEEMTTCKTKEMNLAMQTIKEEQTEEKLCQVYQALYACYPSCYCDNAKNKAAIDAGIELNQKSFKDTVCVLKCGAGSALAPGMALTLALMVAARLYE